jgi:hypothetical protein
MTMIRAASTTNELRERCMTTKKLRFTAFAFVAAGLPFCAAIAASASSGQYCSIGGWSKSEQNDGRQIPVRKAPSADSRLVAKLPTFDERPSTAHSVKRVRTGAAEFSIVESRNGWFRVADVEIVQLSGDSWDKKPRKVSGWVEGKHISFKVQSSWSFTEPRINSAPVAILPGWIGGNWFGLTDCQGDWAKISVLPYDDTEDIRPKNPLTDYERHKSARTAWVNGICRETMIGCDDVVGFDQ